MINRNYIKFHLGDKMVNCHIDAVHAQAPNSDQYTGEIVEAVINEIDCSGIISIISRTVMDINRPRDNRNAPAVDEYRNAIRQIIMSKEILGLDSKLLKNYLHLAIHGMRNDRGTDFEIGTRFGNSCSQEIEFWFIEELKQLSTNLGVNSKFPGDRSKSVHRNGDPNGNYDGYGIKFNTIQIEINRTWRKTKQNELVDFFKKIIGDFDGDFN
jgi:N-formylglutamate amidohydrolase